MNWEEGVSYRNPMIKGKIPVFHPPRVKIKLPITNGNTWNISFLICFRAEEPPHLPRVVVYLIRKYLDCVVYSIYTLVTLASLQRVTAVQNNSLSTHRCNKILCRDKHSTYSDSLAATVWETEPPKSLMPCAFNYLWGENHRRQHLVQVWEH